MNSIELGEIRVVNKEFTLTFIKPKGAHQIKLQKGKKFICLEMLATPPRFGSKNTDGILNVLNDNGIIYIAILSQLLECTEPL